MEKKDFIFIIKNSLSTMKAVEILETPDNYTTICVPPCKPKAGEVYLFDLEAEKADDWKCDQYRWVNQGVKSLPRKSPKLKKSYFSIDTPSGPSRNFQRHSYQLIRSDRIAILVHYTGDESEAIDFPHRSAHKTVQPFFRTLPSYMNTCAKMVEVAKANIVYKKEIASMKYGDLKEIAVPRNVQQLRNLRFKVLSDNGKSPDGLSYLHALAYGRNTKFIWKIETYPDLLCILGLKEIMEEMDRVLQLKEEGQLLSYDTTFNLGDFYVSLLIFRNVIFKENPCIPVAFLIHENKQKDTHETFFSFIIENSKALKKYSLPFVTDREVAITTAIRAKLPNIRLVYCWNHLFRDVEVWLKKHRGNHKDVAFYCANLRTLLEAESEQIYHETLRKLRPQWDASFEEYYINCLHDDILTGAGKWILEGLNIYRPFSGVTNNQSESLNRVLKDLQDWKELSVDCLALSLYNLQMFYMNEIKRGLSGTGTYNLAERFLSLKSTHYQAECVSVDAPEDIVKFIKTKNVIPQSKQSEDEVIFNGDEKVDVPTYTFARAMHVIRNNNISFDTKLRVFIIKQPKEEATVVTMFPKPKCSCLSSVECFHILAAKITLGMNIKDTHIATTNLTKLRKRNRSQRKLESKRFKAVEVPDITDESKHTDKFEETPRDDKKPAEHSGDHINRQSVQECSAGGKTEKENEIDESGSNSRESYHKRRLTRISKFPSQYLLEAKVHTYKIYDQSILSLIQENGWVSDEIITAYLHIQVQENKLSKEVYVIDVAMMNKICNGDFLDQHHKNVTLNIASHSMTIGAYHQNGNHWVLLAIELHSSAITYIDPIGENHDTSSILAENWRNFASQQYKKGNWKKQYKFKVTLLHHPLQKDGHSCGVLVMKFAECLLKQQQLKLSIRNINRYREEMAMQILRYSEPLTKYCRCCSYMEDTSDTDLWVKCDTCNWWYHLKCINKQLKRGLSEKEAKLVTFIGPCCSINGEYIIE